MNNSAKAKRGREMLIMMLTRVPTVSRNILFDVVSLLPLEMRGLTKVVSDQNGDAKSQVIRENKDEVKQVGVSYALKRMQEHSEYVVRYKMKQDPH
jgi:hypothetical protein